MAALALSGNKSCREAQENNGGKEPTLLQATITMSE